MGATPRLLRTVRQRYDAAGVSLCPRGRALGAAAAQAAAGDAVGADGGEGGASGEEEEGSGVRRCARRELLLQINAGDVEARGRAGCGYGMC